MDERRTIETILACFPRSGRQENAPFECDCELVRMGGELWGMTVDEFSPEEDLFTSDDPEALGANLATATLSDLFAAGAAPAFFMHALCLPRDAEGGFVTALCRGIASVLKESGCALCGGDIGAASTWRFTGIALGRVAGERAITHVMPREPHGLWTTGFLGDANLAALGGLPTPRFELRGEAATVIRRHATACIDTSSGFLEAVWLLHRVNPAMRLEIDLPRVPLAPGLRVAAAAGGFPPEAALLGAAGEYELVFAVPESVARIAGDDLAAVGATRIGDAAPVEPGGLFLRRGGSASPMIAPPPCPRGAESHDAYVEAVMRMARIQFAPGTRRG